LSAGEFRCTTRNGRLMKKTAPEEQVFASRKESCTPMTCETFSRREFLAVSAAAGATILLSGGLSAAAEEKTMMCPRN
jgi:hypothetical protein